MEPGSVELMVVVVPIILPELAGRGLKVAQSVVLRWPAVTRQLEDIVITAADQL